MIIKKKHTDIEDTDGMINGVVYNKSNTTNTFYTWVHNSIKKKSWLVQGVLISVTGLFIMRIIYSLIHILLS